MEVFFLFNKKAIPKNLKKILVIRAGMLGDVLLTTSLVKAIRKKYPKTKIYYLVGEWSKDILKDNKDINKLIAFDDTIVFKRKFFQVLNLIRTLRKERFDLCFVLDKSYLWNIFAFLCKIPFRIGFDREGEGFCNNLNVKFDGTKHELDYYLEICRLLDIKLEEDREDINLAISKKDEVFATGIIKKYNLENKTIIGIAPGGAKNPGQEMTVKRWPKERYIELINRLIKNKKISVILFGGKDDVGLAQDIAKNTRANIVNLAGKSTIQESAALIKKCNLFITHDSGLMHIAAAVKIPLLVLFGPTSATRFAPKNSAVIKSHLSCAPCYDIYGNYKQCENAVCMESISTEEVESAIHKILKDS